MARIRRIDGVRWIAIACTAAATVAIFVYFATDRFDAWAPNIATEAVSIAITVGLVTWIIGRERQRRAETMLAWAYRALSRAFVQMGIAAAQDYSETHSDSTYIDPPEDLSDFLLHWRLEVTRADVMPDTALDDLRAATSGFAQAIEQIRTAHASVLSYEHVRSTDVLAGLQEVIDELRHIQIYAMPEEEPKAQHRTTVVEASFNLRGYLDILREHTGVIPRLPKGLHKEIRSNPDRRFIRLFPPGL